MAAKTSISLTDAQAAYARELVERGHYPSVNAVLHHGLELLRTECEVEDAEPAALRALVANRRDGEFVSVTEARKRADRTIAAKKAKR